MKTDPIWATYLISSVSILKMHPTALYCDLISTVQKKHCKFKDFHIKMCIKINDLPYFKAPTFGYILDPETK